tara:strand:- start:574 stop:912 length:339 start_codon:yes stop_codon:yes gene_type:complete
MAYKMKGHELPGPNQRKSPAKSWLKDAGKKAEGIAKSDAGTGAIAGLASGGGWKGALIGGLMGHLKGKKKKEEKPKTEEKSNLDMSGVADNLKEKAAPTKKSKLDWEGNLKK